MVFPNYIMTSDTQSVHSLVYLLSGHPGGSMFFLELFLMGYTPRVCIRNVCASPNSLLEAPISHGMVFGDATFGRWLGLDEMRRGNFMLRLVPDQKRHQKAFSISAERGHVKKVATCKPERGSIQEPHPSDTLIWDLQPPELWEDKCLLFKPLWSMVCCHGSLNWLRLTVIQCSDVRNGCDPTWANWTHQP